MGYKRKSKVVCWICKQIFVTRSLLVDHLECVSKKKGCNQYWRYPIREDEQEVETDQIIPCNIIGSWDLSSLQYDNDDGNGTSLFVLENWEIIGIFMSMYSTQATKN